MNARAFCCCVCYICIAFMNKYLKYTCIFICCYFHASHKSRIKKNYFYLFIFRINKSHIEKVLINLKQCSQNKNRILKTICSKHKIKLSLLKCYSKGWIQLDHGSMWMILMSVLMPLMPSLWITSTPMERRWGSANLWPMWTSSRIMGTGSQAAAPEVSFKCNLEYVGIRETCYIQVVLMQCC